MERGTGSNKEQLQQSEERFKLLVECIRDYAIFMLDPDGVVLTWNAGAERFKGYQAHEIIGQHFSRFYPPEALARNLPEHELEVASKTGVFEDEGWRVRKDGTLSWAKESPTMQSSCSIPTAGWPLGIALPSASRAIRRTRSSASTFRFSIRRT